jgi:hypothetical protein
VSDQDEWRWEYDPDAEHVVAEVERLAERGWALSSSGFAGRDGRNARSR